MRKKDHLAAKVIVGVIRGSITKKNFGRALMGTFGDWTGPVQSPGLLFFDAIEFIPVIYPLKCKSGS